jgi:hypothetical protein
MKLRADQDPLLNPLIYPSKLILRFCPVPDIINTTTRRDIGSIGHETEELYVRIQTQSGAGKHAA